MKNPVCPECGVKYKLTVKQIDGVLQYYAYHDSPDCPRPRTATGASKRMCLGAIARKVLDLPDKIK